MISHVKSYALKLCEIHQFRNFFFMSEFTSELENKTATLPEFASKSLPQPH